MIRRVAMVALLASMIALALAACAYGFPVVVQTVAIEGNGEIRTRDILDVVSFAEGDEIQLEDLKGAAEAIFDLGWFSEVVPDVSESGAVVFRVVENPVIEEIEIVGNDYRQTYSLFGIPLFKAHIVGDSRARSILRNNDVRKGDVLNRKGLEDAIDEIRKRYSDQGFVLISFGNIDLSSSVLRIEIIEAMVVGNVFEGLNTVPVSVAEAIVDLPLNEPLQQKDIAPIMRRLQESVYFSNYNIIPQSAGNADEVYLAWQLEERTLLDAPAAVQSVVLEGVTELSDEDITAVLPELTGETLDNYGLLKAMEDVFNLYYKRGYTMVDFRVREIAGDALHVEVKEGIVSSIEITGNTSTKTYVIERNIDLKVGRVFRYQDHLTTQQGLSSLGYFATVNVLPEWTDEGVAVSIVVTEETRLGGINGSVAVDPNTGAIVGELGYNQRNLGGTGQDLSLSYSRGMDDNNEVLGTSVWNLGYSTVAYFPGFDRVSLDFYQETKTVTVEETDDAEDTEETLITLGGEASFAYPVADYLNARVSYKHEEERLESETKWTPIDAVTLSLVYDDRNDYYFPTHGTRRLAAIEQAGGFAAGQEYTKVDLSWVSFTEMEGFSFLGMDQVFGIRFRAGLGAEGLPASQTYELGGATSVRGAEPRSVERMLVANTEYRVEITEGLVISAFADAGFDLDTVRLDDTQASFGLEMGFNVSGIYVRVDLAWVLGPDMTWVPRFDYGFGPIF